MSRENPAQRERRFIVRTGLFVAGALLLAMVVVALIGKENRLFERKVVYRAAFESVDGLKQNAPVWLGGLEVGAVLDVSLPENLEDRRIVVEMEIGQEHAPRIRKDSVARITSRGVLGDKAIDISIGTAGQSPLNPGEELPTGTSGDLSALLKSSGEVMDNAIAITRDVRRAITAYTDPKLTQNLTGTAESVHRLVKAVEQGDGALNALFFDPETRKDVRSLVDGAAKSAQRLDGAIGEVESILRAVRVEKGAMHALFYDRRTGDALGELGDAAGELAKLISDARTQPNGAVHQLVYGDTKNMMGDLGATAADVRAIVGKIKAGEGTLGGIIYDPTVYEDLRTILGNMKRNRVLRALVRFSLSNGDEMEKVGEVREEGK